AVWMRADRRRGHFRELGRDHARDDSRRQLTAAQTRCGALTKRASGKCKTPERPSGDGKIDRTRRCVDDPDQNATSRIAPTKGNTANTASTLSLNARSTSRLPMRLVSERKSNRGMTKS